MRIECFNEDKEEYEINNYKNDGHVGDEGEYRKENVTEIRERDELNKNKNRIEESDQNMIKEN